MSALNSILEGLNEAKSSTKIDYDDFTKKGNKFKLNNSTYYGSADAIMDKAKAKKLGFKIEREDPDGYFEISIPKGTILKATGAHGKGGVALEVNGIELDFAAPEEMDVVRI